MDSAIIKIDLAKQALMEARSIEEVLELRDRAMSAHAYAIAKGYGEAANIAKEAQLRAERRAGEFLSGPSGPQRGRPEKMSTDSTFNKSVKLPDLGISRDASSKWQAIASVPEVRFEQYIEERQRNGNELTQSGLLNLARKLKREQELEEQRDEISQIDLTIQPEGPFDVIVIDPPWPYGTKYDPDGRRAANPYPEMNLDEIAAIELSAADDCVLWLWTTHKFMRHSFAILDAWGFRDVAILTWVKNRMGLGQWLRSKSEFCIMAVKGSPKVVLTNQTTVIHGPMREHSRKPDEFYEMVESLCLGIRRQDYFSREPRPRWAHYHRAISHGLRKVVMLHRKPARIARGRAGGRRGPRMYQIGTLSPSWAILASQGWRLVAHDGTRGIFGLVNWLLTSHPFYDTMVTETDNSASQYGKVGGTKMATELTVWTGGVDPMGIIARSARLGDSTKAKYTRALAGYLETGGNIGDAQALAAYASGLSQSVAGNLKSAVALVADAIILDAKSQAAPDNTEVVTAAIYRAEALKAAIQVKTPKGEKAHTWLKPEQVLKLYQATNGDGIVGERDKVALGLLVGAGLRREEAVNLTFDDIELLPVKERIRTVLNVQGKGAKNRVIPISDHLANLIDAWGKRVGHTGRIIRSLGRNREIGESISAVALFNLVRKYGARIGKPELAAHDLRRTYAQIGYEAGIPITQLSKLLGHASVTTTQRYLNLSLNLETTASDFVPWG